MFPHKFLNSVDQTRDQHKYCLECSLEREEEQSISPTSSRERDSASVSVSLQHFLSRLPSSGS